MLLSELIRQAARILEANGDMKIYIGDDDPTRLLMRPLRLGVDVFCPECGEKYCEIDANEAPDEYFENNECC